MVVFQSQVRTADLDVMLDVLSDIMLNSTFNEDRIQNEARVILEELNSRKANPNVLAADVFFPAVFGSHPLARSTAGDLENTPRLTRDAIVGYRAPVRRRREHRHLGRRQPPERPGVRPRRDVLRTVAARRGGAGL